MFMAKQPSFNTPLSSICPSELWLGINVGDAFWLYFYVMGIVDPVPRNALTRTSSGWSGYEVMMFLFGFPWSCVNLFASIGIIAGALEAGKGRGQAMQGIMLFFIIVVLVPAGIFISILPFFGGWIVTPIVQSGAWNHRCDGYPMYAILDGKAYNGPSYVKDVAYFYLNGKNNVQFTYEISNPGDDDQWYFRLQKWNVDQLSIPVDAYPTLQSVGYNFADNTVTGNCTVPSSPSVFTNNTSTRPCVTGTFDQGNQFFFNITSSVPLNNTADADTTQSFSSALAATDSPWFVNNAPPALVLREQEPSSGSNNVLRTAVARPHDCTELKVCIAGVQGREGSQVMAEVLAPLGVVLMRQSDHAVECTTPSD
ncbi:hypothetical protein BC835DRAFT_1412805 [Cytidiella melzeri]|nr:hypothetical protein BC835DRAFT_1412805 [Cytidiella melzeri]